MKNKLFENLVSNIIDRNREETEKAILEAVCKGQSTILIKDVLGRNIEYQLTNIKETNND